MKNHLGCGNGMVPYYSGTTTLDAQVQSVRLTISTWAWMAHQLLQDLGAIVCRAYPRGHFCMYDMYALTTVCAANHGQ